MALKQVVDRLRLAGHDRIYTLGCGERRVTIYEQQVRALNLAWALNQLGEIPSGT